MSDLFIVHNPTEDKFVGKTRDGYILTTRDNATLFDDAAATSIASAMSIGCDEAYRILPAPTAGDLFLKYRYQARAMAKLVIQGPHLHHFQELAESQLALIIMTKWDTFDPSRASRSTWVGRKIIWHLLTARKRQFSQPGSLPPVLTSEPRSRDKMYADLGTEAQRLVRWLRKNPEARMAAFGCCDSREEIERYLTERDVTNGKPVSVVLDEIEEVLYE